jgi:predicted amidophosphoribosyltransferase
VGVPAWTSRWSDAGGNGLLSTLLDLVLPHICPGCGAAEPWCDECAKPFTARPQRLLPPANVPFGGLPPIYAIAVYTGPVRAVVLAAKERGRRDLPLRLGDALGAALLRLHRIGVLDRAVWLVPAPTRASAARERGGDPVTIAARRAAELLAAANVDVGVAPCLSTGRGAVDSVGLDPIARRANLAGRIRFRACAAPPPSAAVVLVDDVITTGTTVDGASRVLSEHGFRMSAAVTLAAAARWWPRRLS